MLNTLAIERIRMVYIKVKKINDNVILPTYETSSSAGMDIRAFLPNGKVSISPKETKLIGTGLFFEIPNGFAVQIRPRSGLAVKKFITVSKFLINFFGGMNITIEQSILERNSNSLINLFFFSCKKP